MTKKFIKEKLLNVISLHTQVYGIDPVKGNLIVYNQKALNESHWQELREKQATYMHIVARMLEGLKKDGKMADLNTRVSAFALFGMIQWAHLWYNPKGPVKPKELEKNFIRIFTRGILDNEKMEVD